MNKYLMEGRLNVIQLFTDSAANLPRDFIEKYQIEVIPLTYTVDGKEQNELTDIFAGETYYNELRSGSVVKTSMINTEMFKRRFEEQILLGNDIIYVGMSSGISGTINASCVAADELKSKYPNSKIEIIDTLGASLGEGMLVLETAKMIELKLSIENIKKQVKLLVPKMCQCLTVDDLKYLRKSGRISGAAALIGGLLGIHPLLIGNDQGKIVMYSKTRGLKGALESLADRYAKLVTDKAREIGIAHADNLNGARYLLDCLKKRGFCGSCTTVCYEPVTGSHVGPGAVALFFFGKNRSL